MARFGFNTVFSKLFASVMLTLVLFAVAMLSLTHLVYDNTAETRWQILARQIVNQVDPFVDELDNAITMQERLQARFMLAVIKKSFDIFDESLQAKLALYDRNGHLLIQTDDSSFPHDLPTPPSAFSRVIPFLDNEPNNVQVISDRGYTIVYAPRNPPKRSELWAVLNLFTGTLLLIAVMALVLWWIARSMTWRIDKMNQQMIQLGEGDFSARVPVKGNDEIASLSRGFNQTAQKIEQLINANNLLLAHASHEIRTPITRIRLQIEMMQMLASNLPDASRAKFDKRAEAVNRDLTGLNELVESILLVSRLDAGHAAQSNEKVDLYELVNQESQHYPEAVFLGQAIKIEGQPKLLIHLIRNLLNNAIIHGVPPIQVQLYGAMTAADAYVPPTNLDQLNEFDATASHSDSKDSEASDGANANSDSYINIDAKQRDSNRDSVNNESQSVSDNGQPILTTDDTNADTCLDGDSTHKPTHITQNQEAPKKGVKQALQQKLKRRPKGDHTKDQLTVERIGTDSKETENKTNEGRFSKLRRNKAPIPANPQANFAVLAVIDKGEGIPEEKREEIFSPFVRLQQKRKGSGLGLSLVAQIVEAHQGIIRSDTYKGHTRFIVILPTHPDNAAQLSELNNPLISAALPED